MQEAIKGNAVELISCCEIEAMPAEGIVTFIEFLYRDPEERDYHSAIQCVGITFQMVTVASIPTVIKARS